MATELRNTKGYILQVGVNYHTTWQKYRGMRFVLSKVEADL